MEVRYIIFTTEEVRSAVTSFIRKQGQMTSSDEVIALEIAGPHDAPAAIVRLQARQEARAIDIKVVNIDTTYLAAALVLYCIDRRIPLPKDGAKKVELSVNGLTLRTTTDRSQGTPVVANLQVTYGEIANRAMQTIGTVQEHLARVQARAEYAESQMALAEERARKAEAARGRSSAMLTAIAILPGLRGHVGRWLVKFQFPYSDEWA